MRRALCLALFLSQASTILADDAATRSEALPDHVQGFLESYCVSCHQGKRPKAKLDLARFQTKASMAANPKVWQKMLVRIRDGEMPPEDEDMPSKEEHERFVEWVDASLRSSACADGIAPGPATTRRLNRDEYAATIRDLLGVHFNAADALPSEGAGGEGFDNTAETLTLSPVHLEKYLDAATEALRYAIKNPASREKLLIATPSAEVTAGDAARKILESFVPRAFRRPTRVGEIDSYLALFRDAQKEGDSFDDAVLFALEGVLISPYFIFRVEEPVKGAAPQPLDDFELASRLSYFLWGSLPDRTLFDLASKGKLQDPEELARQVVRMLRDRRARGFATSFIGQWLGTRELGSGVKPDRSLSRRYDDDLEAVIRYEPILFFNEILAKNLSIMTLLDADFSYMNNELARHYRLRIDGLREHPKRVDLPSDSHRGGVLGMAAVLAVSSYPHRTSPVLRGKWVLETLLGTPPPPPPTDVPELEENGKGVDAATVRERLLEHRTQPQCATCHDRIDPIGFGLENYDVLGRWRTKDAGKPIDSKGQLPDGSTFDGPEELKEILLRRKPQFTRHFTTKLLGYALNRGLTIEDYCTVETIAEKIERHDHQSHRLIIEIVQSVPFRYKAGSDPSAPVKSD